MESKRESYSDRYIAFIDVLGFSNIVGKSAHDPVVVERVHAALAGISRKAAENRSTILGFEVTSFSDSVVFSLPVNAAGLLHLIRVIEGFCNDLLSLGMLFRGAVTRGQALHTREVIFGPAMVEAYRLESSVSFHPRVMLDQAVMADARSFSLKQKLWRDAISQYIAEDPFDIPYLEPFARWADDDAAWTEDAIANLVLFRTLISDGLSENAGRPSIAEKYRWLARKLNAFITAKRLGQHIHLIGVD